MDPNNLPEKKLERLRNLIFSHDLNGISLKQGNNKEYVGEYTKLVKTLGLENVSTFQQKSEEFEINKETARTVIDSVFADDKINDFYKIFDLSKGKSLQNNINRILVKRGDGYVDTKVPHPQSPPKKKEKKEVSIAEKRKEVTIYFLNLIALFILFQDEDEENCTETNVTDGLERIQNIKPVLEPFAYKELCEDDTKENAMLKCYLRMAIEGDAGIKGTIDIKVVKFLLETFNKRIQTFQEMVEMIKKDNIKELNNIYCNIKNSFLMEKKKYHPENLSTKPCSDTFIKNEKILNIIRERLTVRTTEKEQHGEVFTPPELICEMLDTLPASVWGNKDLKWLDPANGIGNFPVIVYYKLMDGLKKTIPDDKERSKHIIEKMLFMVELNPVNVKVSRKIFRMMDSDTKPNIVKANFLTESSKWKRAILKSYSLAELRKETSKTNIKKYSTLKKADLIELMLKSELKIVTFDIVMGNPPYNEGGIRANSTEHYGLSLIKNHYLFFVTRIHIYYLFIQLHGFH